MEIIIGKGVPKPATADKSALQVWADKVVQDTLLRPEALLKDAFESEFSYGEEWGKAILNSAHCYLVTGKRVAAEFSTEAFFELSDEDTPKPFVLTHPPDDIGLNQKSDDEEAPEMVKCCDGKGDHEYEEGDDPDCDCRELDCGCIYDPNDNNGDIYVCSNCESTCESCCESCSSCSNCGDRYSSENMCSNCDCCEKCCSKASECMTCGSCDHTKNSDKFNCSNCDLCNKCCSCRYCEYCEESHDSDTPFCGDCDRCSENCKCTKCKGCDTEHDDLDGEYCEGCGYCNGCGCECPEPPTPPFKAQTQKAKGMQVIRQMSVLNVPSFSLARAQGIDPNRLVNRFVRPCPMVPRHGFVDSRSVSTLEEAEQVIKETLAADAEAEFILMDKIPADYSGVWTPGLMVLGPSHDGATAGRNSVTVPVAGDYLAHLPNMLEAAGITNAPYVELLWRMLDSGHVQTHAVQLRDGPKLPQQTDYIAEATTVSKVVLAEGDLLEWETLMKNQPAGTVVYHPGGSLASHYAIHAVLNKIPILISREPKVGDVLFCNTDGVEESKPDMDRVRAGFFYALTVKTPLSKSTTPAAFMMLLGCHSTVLWMGKQDILLGAALGFAYRLSITAAVGEWRHRSTAKNKPQMTREATYEGVWDRIFKVRQLYMRTLKDFRQLRWADGMGGEKWFQFTRWAATIFNSIKSGDLNAALAAMNNAVHASHNNGWGFNKFAPSNSMDVIAANPVQAFKHCAPLVYGALSMDAGTKQDAEKWFAKTKPLPIEQADAWLALDSITRETAASAQAKLDGGKVIVQYKQASNSVAYGIEVVPVPEGKFEKINEIMAAMKQDGRLMRSLVPSDSDEREFVPLHRDYSHVWGFYDTKFDKFLNLHKQPEVTETEVPTSALTDDQTISLQEIVKL